jgi:hypothetical protein
MAYSLSNPNPGPSLNPREDWSLEFACHFCNASTPILESYRVECSECDGACPSAVVLSCYPCSTRRFLCPLCEEIEATADEDEAPRYALLPDDMPNLRPPTDDGEEVPF